MTLPIQPKPEDSTDTAVVYRGLTVKCTADGSPILNDPRIQYALEAILEGGTSHIVFSKQGDKFSCRMISDSGDEAERIIEQFTDEFGYDASSLKAFRWAAGHALAGEETFDLGVDVYTVTVGTVAAGYPTRKAYFGDYRQTKAWSDEQREAMRTEGIPGQYFTSTGSGKALLVHTVCGQWLTQDFDEVIHHVNNERDCQVPLDKAEVGRTIVLP